MVLQPSYTCSRYFWVLLFPIGFAIVWITCCIVVATIWHGLIAITFDLSNNLNDVIYSVVDVYTCDLICNWMRFTLLYVNRLGGHHRLIIFILSLNAFVLYYQRRPRFSLRDRGRMVRKLILFFLCILLWHQLL